MKKCLNIDLTKPAWQGDQESSAFYLSSVRVADACCSTGLFKWVLCMKFRSSFLYINSPVHWLSSVAVAILKQVKIYIIQFHLFRIIRWMIAKERCTQPLQNHFLLHWNICIFIPGNRVDYEVNNSIFFHKLIEEFHSLLHSPTKHLNSFNNSHISNCVRREINYFKAPPKFFFFLPKEKHTNKFE